MSRFEMLASCALSVGVLSVGVLSVGVLTTAPAIAQDLHTPPVAPPSAATPPAPPTDPEQVRFSAAQLDYDSDQDIVTTTGDVRMVRDGNRLRADKVVWNRKTGKVLATGNVAVVNPQGDVAYGDSIDLTDTLKDGVVDNMLIVLEQGGRLAAERGVRQPDGTVNVTRGAYTPCDVTTRTGCPKEPSWKVTAVRITYRPERQRIYFSGAQFHLFGLPSFPLPKFSYPVGPGSDSGLLGPTFRISHVNGAEIGLPYYFRLAPNKGLTLTPYLFSAVLPMFQAKYEQLGTKGAFAVEGYVTDSRRSDDLNSTDPTDTERAVRGYIDAVGNYQFNPNWSATASIRVASDRTFLRRYNISNDDRLRSNVEVDRVDADSYLSIAGWYVQTLRVADAQGLQPIALPVIDYRRRFADPVLGGKFELELNTLGITRPEGQDTQRAFASLRWDLRKLTDWGQQVTFTALARGDLYHTSDVLSSPAVYQGDPGFQGRAIGALAIDVQWPFIGTLAGGTQRFTPRLQIVASPKLKNITIPNEDSRAVDLDTADLFSLNRFPGYDRVEDSSRATYGLEWAYDHPGLTIDTVVGQSYRLDQRPTIFYPGTGLSDRFSDIVGRTEIRFRDFVALTHSYRLDKSNLAFRRNEIDATIGSRATYVLLGYLNLNRNISPPIEDLQDREEARVAGRVQFARFWSAFGSAVVDLTNRSQDPLSLSDGFSPVTHRIGVQYEDNCLRLGLTWKREYNQIGDARQGNSFQLTLALTNLGR